MRIDIKAVFMRVVNRLLWRENKLEDWRRKVICQAFNKTWPRHIIIVCEVSSL